MAFLTSGGYSSFTGVVAGQLDPWPSNVAPGTACVAPVANAGGPYTVSSGGTVTLGATSSGTAPTFAWTPLAALSGSLSNASIPDPVYTAPVVSTTKVVNVSVTATNACGTNTSATKTITVNPSGKPIVKAATASVHRAFARHVHGRCGAADRHPEDRWGDVDFDGERADHHQRRQQPDARHGGSSVGCIRCGRHTVQRQRDGSQQSCSSCR